MLIDLICVIAIWGVIIGFCVEVIKLDEKGRKDK